MAKERGEKVFCLECRHSAVPGYLKPLAWLLKQGLASDVSGLVCTKRTADFVERGASLMCMRCSDLNFDGECLAFEKIPPIEPGEMTPGNQE